MLIGGAVYQLIQSVIGWPGEEDSGVRRAAGARRSAERGTAATADRTGRAARAAADGPADPGQLVTGVDGS